MVEVSSAKHRNLGRAAPREITGLVDARGPSRLHFASRKLRICAKNEMAFARSVQAATPVIEGAGRRRKLTLVFRWSTRKCLFRP
jgi:hypothetical protein